MSRTTASPLVSVVLPTYNGSHYLAQSVDSVLAQTLQDLELIIVDDASTDATPDIIAELAKKDPRIRPFRNTANLKLPASLNAGFRQSRGRFLTWTSDDNLYRPGALARLVEVLSDNPGASLVYSDYSNIDEDGTEIRRVYVPGPEMLPFHNPVGGCFLYRREILDRIGGYDENLFLVEDYDYWLRISQECIPLAHHENLYCYRLHEASLTTRRARQVAVAQERALRTHLPRLSWLSRPHRALAHLVLAVQMHRNKEQALSRRNLTSLLLTAPCMLFAGHRQSHVKQILDQSIPEAAEENRAFFAHYFGEKMLYLAGYAYFGSFGLAWAYRLQNLLGKFRRLVPSSHSGTPALR